MAVVIAEVTAMEGREVVEGAAVVLGEIELMVEDFEEFLMTKPTPSTPSPGRPL